MRLEWLEDILAVMETGSLTRAAEQRFLTQSAFSRRIKQIENYVGVELFDRSTKPVRLKKFVTDQQQNIQEIASGLRDLRNELKRQALETHNQIVIASQHAITTSTIPSLIRKLSQKGKFNTRLRSANRDQCYALLIAKQADFILIHHSENEQPLAQDSVFDQCRLDQERFIPVYASRELPALMEAYAQGDVAVVAYPADSFLGQIARIEIFPQIRRATTIHVKTETALTLAALPLALAGVGVAWLPYTIAETDLANGNLADLSDIFPSCELSIAAVRLNDQRSAANEAAWRIMTSQE